MAWRGIIGCRKNPQFYTDKKENKIFLIYKEIPMGSGANIFTVYEEVFSHSLYMRKSSWQRKTGTFGGYSIFFLITPNSHYNLQTLC
jgi:hypothetical protein